jgi:3-dehydroquinate dehydratase II
LAQLLLINGPNLNLLGSREPAIYGRKTLADIESEARQDATLLGHELACFQSNHEGELVDRVQQAKKEGVAAIVINAGAFTHTSIALADALASVAIPFIEVHISNVYAREAFRHHSHLSALAAGVIVGCGTLGYRLAVQAAHQKLSDAR